MTETIKQEHTTCTISYYKTENETTLEDGSKQYDKVGYCECGKEVSRESIIEEKEIVIYENCIIDATSGTEYKINFEDGMTWENWLNSDYNTIGLITENNYIYSADKTLVLRLNLTDNIQVTDTIINSDTYKLYAVEEAETKTTFTIFGTEYEYEDGMTWNDYCNSTIYNSKGWYVENDIVYWSTSETSINKLCDSSYKVISASDKIQSTSYTWMGV